MELPKKKMLPVVIVSNRNDSTERDRVLLMPFHENLFQVSYSSIMFLFPTFSKAWRTKMWKFHLTAEFRQLASN